MNSGQAKSYLEESALVRAPLVGRKYARYYVLFGWTQIVIGCLSILFSIITLALDGAAKFSMLETGSGIWCGTVFIGSGVFGVVAGNQPNKEKIKHAMLAAIPSFIFGNVMFGVEIASAASYNPNDSISNNLSKEAAVVALHSSLVILAFILIVITLMQMYLCYGVVYNKFNTATSGISNVYSTSGQLEQSHGQTAA